MTVVVGNGIRKLCVGGNNPVAVQTMWKARLLPEDLEGEGGKAVLRRIEALSALGCDLIRFAVPDMEAAETLGRLASGVSTPLCADIHFDYRIALRCLDFPIAKLRINPGTIGTKSRTEAVLSKAAAKKVPIRIGVNAGSLPLAVRKRFEAGTTGRAEALVETALEEIAVFEEFGFRDFVVSMKASGIADTIKANRLFRRQSAAPLHIGVTEAGPLVAGTVRNAAALLPLLAEGIGDTLRVSLSDTMENEVIAAREILSAAAEAGCGRARRGVQIISCPLCGRNGFDTHAFTERWTRRLYALKKPLSIAVMGCAVNGPGEAKHADLGITGAGNKVLIFRHGKVLRTIDANDADKAFEEELLKL
ncbi:MAG: flavodoxin-dependent (E)-4-hydroxy-3-methylbut-2-enyl-diphosphate synthase [Treponema sp.]|jgi:(E)-4-hydroxy-3-methylbut-2-enyl-diphosphate synthase|nr:flavodoxin-dependent (E)-4-hydroxy-3-methylbut-2-enyl-diphosphate synthase [Treponema sp.]